MKKVSFILLPSLAVILLLWFPYGFHMGGLIEEWGLLWLYVQHGAFFIAGADSLMPSHQMRPFMTTPWAIAFSVDPNSWWFWHVELALSLLIKGASMTWLALYLTGSRRLAIVAGMLLMVWPADTMQMAFRALNIGLSVGLILLSAALLIAAYAAEHRSRRVLLAIGAALCIFVGSWMYEVTLVLAPLPFLVLYARHGISTTLTMMYRRIGVTSAWLLGCLVCLAYIAKVLLTATVTYQQSLTGDEHHALAAVESNLPMLFSHGFVRALLGSWVDALRILVHDVTHPGYIAFVAVVFIVLLAMSRTLKVQQNSLVVRTLAIGAIALALGYSPFLVSIAHLSTTQRTFMFAEPGAVLIFLALLILIDRFQSLVTAAVSVILLVLGTVQQLYQFDAYNRLYESQRTVLRSIVSQIKGFQPGKTVVVLDDSQRLNGTWMLDELMPSALTYLTGKPVVTAMVCLTPQNIWEVRDGLGRQGTCIETPDSWIFRSASPVSGPGVPLTKQNPDIVISKSDVIVARVPIDVHDLDNVSLSGHEATLNASNWPVQLDLFGNKTPSASYHWDFGHRWDVPDDSSPGAGWRNPEWIYTPFRQTSAAWTSLQQSSLIFNLRPIAKDYELGIQTVGHREGVEGKIGISVNGVAIPVEWNGASDLRATIPMGVLKSGGNMIEIDSPPAIDFYGLSLFVDQINLAPKP